MCARHLDEAALAEGQRAHVGVVAVAEPDVDQRRFGTPTPCGLAHVQFAAGGVIDADEHVVEDRQARDQPDALIRPRDAESGPVCAVALRYVASVDVNAPAQSRIARRRSCRAASSCRPRWGR